MSSQPASVPPHWPQIHVTTADRTTAAVELGVRACSAMAGLLAAPNMILGGLSAVRSWSTECLAAVDVDPPSDCGEITEDAQHGEQSTAVGNDVADDAELRSSSFARGRLGRMLSLLPVPRTRPGSRGRQELQKRCVSWSECSRRVAIESSLSPHHSPDVRRRRPASCHVDHHVDTDLPTHQFTTSLTSTDVRNGRFTARLPVHAIPRGDVMIRMRSGRLEVLRRELDQSTAHELSGVVELPIYVDPDSVTVRHEPLEQCLVIDASTKGCRPSELRRRSVSLDELWWPRGRKTALHIGARLRLTWKRCEQDETVILFSETRTFADNTSPLYY